MNKQSSSMEEEEEEAVVAVGGGTVAAAAAAAGESVHDYDDDGKDKKKTDGEDVKDQQPSSSSILGGGRGRGVANTNSSSNREALNPLLSTEKGRSEKKFPSSSFNVGTSDRDHNNVVSARKPMGIIGRSSSGGGGGNSRRMRQNNRSHYLSSASSSSPFALATTTTTSSLSLTQQNKSQRKNHKMLLLPPASSSFGGGEGGERKTITNMKMKKSKKKKRLMKKKRQQQEAKRRHMYHKNTRTLSSLKTRWAVLSLTCLTMTAIYYSYDIPAALHQQLMDRMSSKGSSGNGDETTTEFEVRFNLLYTLYSLPNIILPFFGGNFVDRFGSAQCMLIFTFIVFLGQFIFAVGVSAKTWPLMLFGRCVFGLGGESAAVASSSILARWFTGTGSYERNTDGSNSSGGSGGELAFALGVNLAVSRLGSAANDVLSPSLGESSSNSGRTTSLPYWLGVLFNMGAVASAALVWRLDLRGYQKCAERNRAVAVLTESLLEEEEDDDENENDDDDDVDEEDEEEERQAANTPIPRLKPPAPPGTEPLSSSSSSSPSVRLTDVSKFDKLFWLLSLSCVVVYGCILPFNNVASGILLERNYFIQPPPKNCQLLHSNSCTSGTLVYEDDTNPSRDVNTGESCPGEEYAPVLPTSLKRTQSQNGESYEFDTLNPSDIDCSNEFWSKECTSNYCVAEVKASEHAGRIMSIPYILSAALSPFLGCIIDSIGRRAIIVTLAPAILVIVHAILAVPPPSVASHDGSGSSSSSSPVAPLVFMGVAYSLYASSLWPSVPLAVDGWRTGTAYGVASSVQNAGLTLFPLLVAAIYDDSSTTGGGEGKYLPGVEIFFAICAACGVFVGIALNVVDGKTGNRLNGYHGTDIIGNAVASASAAASAAVGKGRERAGLGTGTEVIGGNVQWEWGRNTILTGNNDTTNGVNMDIGGGADEGGGEYEDGENRNRGLIISV